LLSGKIVANGWFEVTNMAKISECKNCHRKIRKTARGTWMHSVGGWSIKQPKCPKGPEPVESGSQRKRDFKKKQIPLTF
jgi:hypothetical protein